MQEKLTIARPYAAAAFEFASENGVVEQWSELLQGLSSVVEHESFAPLIGHPKLASSDLKSMLAELLGSRLSDSGENFLSALIDAERLELAPQISELFEVRRADAAGSVGVEVISAFELSDSERQKIVDAVSARIGRSCEVSSTVDNALIGGAVIKIGDSVIDLSVRGRLASLSQQLGSS